MRKKQTNQPKPSTTTINGDIVAVKFDGEGIEAVREIAMALRTNAQALHVLAGAMAGKSVQIPALVRVESGAVTIQGGVIRNCP